MSGHSHSGGSCQDHSHDDDSPELGIQYSLYTKIDFLNLECLNEATEDSGKDVFKPWDQRLDHEKFVESDVDEELLFNIPFTGNVKLKGIIVIGGEDEMHPAKMRLFKNRPHLTFDDAQASADQEFEVHHDPNGTLEYSVKIVKFTGTHHLTIHFPKNFGASNTKVYYIGLKGEFQEAHRHEVTICSYESAPNPADHKINALNTATQELM